MHSRMYFYMFKPKAYFKEWCEFKRAMSLILCNKVKKWTRTTQLEKELEVEKARRIDAEQKLADEQKRYQALESEYLALKEKAGNAARSEAPAQKRRKVEEDEKVSGA
jgi:uncharacterized protein YlxW (UPF0749 family)